MLSNMQSRSGPKHDIKTYLAFGLPTVIGFHLKIERQSRFCEEDLYYFRTKTTDSFGCREPHKATPLHCSIASIMGWSKQEENAAPPPPVYAWPDLGIAAPRFLRKRRSPLKQEVLFFFSFSCARSEFSVSMPKQWSMSEYPFDSTF
jgi:hypothetical protein